MTPAVQAVVVQHGRSLDPAHSKDGVLLQATRSNIIRSIRRRRSIHSSSGSSPG
jgi:hypothetical protein